MASALISLRRRGCLAKAALVGLACLLAMAAVLLLGADVRAGSSIGDDSRVREIRTDSPQRPFWGRAEETSITVPPLVVAETSVVSVETGTVVTSLLVATISDPDTPLRDLTVTVRGLPTGLTHSFDTSRGLLTINGTAPPSREVYTIAIEASDGANSHQALFLVNVIPTTYLNTPKITLVNRVLYVEGQREVVPSLLLATISDRDTPLRDLTVTVSGLPTGLTHNFDSSDGRLTVSGTASRSGTIARFMIVVSDGASSTEEELWATIVPPLPPSNVRPVVALVGGMAIEAGASVTSQVVATISDRDTSLRDLTVTVSGLPTGLTHNFDSSDGRLTVSGTASLDEGVHQVTIRVSDGSGSDSETFSITIANESTEIANPAPLELRITVRLDRDGRSEFGVLSTERERILPAKRFLPVAPPVGRWLNSSDVQVDGVVVGRVSVRRLVDGRTEFAFLTAQGERLLPTRRILRSDAAANRWFTSSPFTVVVTSQSCPATDLRVIGTDRPGVFRQGEWRDDDCRSDRQQTSGSPSDAYTFDVSEGSPVTVTLTTASGDDAWVWLLDSNGNNLVNQDTGQPASARDVPGGVEVTAGRLPAGTYALEVTTTTDARGDYQLRMAVEEPFAAAVHDPCSSVNTSDWEDNVISPFWSDNPIVHDAKALLVKVLFQIPLGQDPVHCTIADYNDFGEPAPIYIKGHAGWDVQTVNVAAAGTADVPFYSLTDGEVVYVDSVADPDPERKRQGRKPLGAIGVYHNVEDFDFTVYYFHARHVYVREGQRVSVDQRLGIQGDTGSPGKEHVHIEVHRGRNHNGKKHPFTGAVNAPNRGGSGTLLLWHQQLNYLCEASAGSWLRLDNESCPSLDVTDAPSPDPR